MPPITDDEKALLATIRKFPEYDAPRLVYADWLEERAGRVAETRDCGDCIGGQYRRYHPVEIEQVLDCEFCAGSGKVTEMVPDGLAERAELIRLQCELHRDLTEPELHADRQPGIFRMITLLRDWGDVWAGPHLPYWRGRSGCACPVTTTGTRLSDAHWERGFVVSWSGPVAWFVACGPALLERHLVDSITVTDKTPYPAGDTHHWYEGEHEDGVHPDSDLPVEVYDRLTGGTVNSEYGFRRYSSRADAVEDLLAALRSLLSPGTPAAAPGL